MIPGAAKLAKSNAPQAPTRSIYDIIPARPSQVECAANSYPECTYKMNPAKPWQVECAANSYPEHKMNPAPSHGKSNAPQTPTRSQLAR